jgi:hypothetical protein
VGTWRGFAAGVERLGMPESRGAEIAPLLTVIRTASAELDAVDGRIAAIAAEE